MKLFKAGCGFAAFSFGIFILAASPLMADTLSASPTPTVTDSTTPALSPTFTPTLDASASPTVSPTATPTVTPILTPTPTPTVTPGPARSWVFSVGGAVDLPVKDWNPAYTIGYGYGLDLSTPLDPLLTLGLGLSYFHYQGLNDSGQVTNDDLRILPGIRFDPLGGSFHPYLTGGLGFDLQFATAQGSTVNNLNPDGYLGLGCEAHLGIQAILYLEARYNLTLADSDLGQDTALSGGLRDSF